MMADLAELTDRLVAPIAPGNAAGTNIRYEPDFEALKAETDKLGTLAGGDVDWDRVVTLSETILGSKSKDLLVASYLCVGLLHRDGYHGLGTGVEVLRRIVETFWDDLFPEKNRLRARATAVEWLVERCAATVRQRPPRTDEVDALAAVQDALARLSSALDERLGPLAPSFGDLRDALGEAQRDLPVAAPEPPPAAVVTAPVPVVKYDAPPAAPASRADLSSAEGREEALKDRLAALRELASQMEKADPADPLGYRLMRVGVWSTVRRLPAHTAGKTRIPAGGASPEFAQRLASLGARGDWLGVVALAEQQFQQSKLWFDLQFAVIGAFDALGPAYDRPRDVVRRELAALLRELPALVDMRFENDLPFASEPTRAFIHGELLAGGGTGAAVSAVPAARAGSDNDAEFEELLARSLDLLRASKGGDGVRLLHEAVGRAASGRQRFVRRLALARQLAETREFRLALAQLDELDREIDLYRLAEWEPALAADALQLAVHCQRAMLKGDWKAVPDAARRADDLFARLARLDPASALGLKN